nr:DUF5703 domain-containing protein [Allomuricauda sp.]
MDIRLSSIRNFKTAWIVLVTILATHEIGAQVNMPESVGRYNVVWNSPSKDPSGAMPIGNGDMGAMVYAIENGDLYLLMSKNDAITYMGDLFKTGRVKISLSNNPFEEGKSFKQTLDIEKGCITIATDDTDIKVWTDMNRNVCHVEVNSSKEVEIEAEPEFWQRFDGCVGNVTGYSVEQVLNPTQDVLMEGNNHLMWYYHVGDRSIMEDDLDFFNVEHMKNKLDDPFRYNTFGNLLESDQLTLEQGKLKGKSKHFDIRIHAKTKQAKNPKDWIKELEKQAFAPINVEKDWQAHVAWWSKYWNRSWIIASDNSLPEEHREAFSGEWAMSHLGPGGWRVEEDGAALAAQSYNMFRYFMASQGRGKYPVKFNGGIFTMQQLLPFGHKRKRTKAVPHGLLTHEDERLYGRRYTFQNQRLMYWPSIMNGDYDILKVFFEYYTNMLPMRKAITKALYGHEGAYFRENMEINGGERDCWRNGRPQTDQKPQPGTKASFFHDYYFTSGLEATMMMLSYVETADDREYLNETVVPFAKEVLTFFKFHFEKDEDGKLSLDPSMALETWWKVKNPSTDVAGLRSVLTTLIQMEAGTKKDRDGWKDLLAMVPEIPMRTIDGKLAIAPGETWDSKHNAENPETYACFPFQNYGVAWGTEDIVQTTMEHRVAVNKYHYGCWTQDQIIWAYAGNAKEAAFGLDKRFRRAESVVRFPIFGRVGPDECPDFDHLGSGSIAMQRMLVQEGNGKIILLPAWPKTWDADFKLHVGKGAILTGSVKDGKLENWDITPKERKKDVEVRMPQ